MSTVQARLAVSIIHENHMNAQPETVHWYPQCLLFVVDNYEFQGLSFDFDGKSHSKSKFTVSRDTDPCLSMSGLVPADRLIQVPRHRELVQSDAARRQGFSTRGMVKGASRPGYYQYFVVRRQYLRVD